MESIFSGQINRNSDKLRLLVKFFLKLNLPILCLIPASLFKRLFWVVIDMGSLLCPRNWRAYISDMPRESRVELKRQIEMDYAQKKNSTLTLRRSLTEFASSKDGSSLPEYAVLVSVIAVALIGATVTLGDTVSRYYEEVTYQVEEPMLVETGYVSPFKDEQVIGIAKDYKGKVTFMDETAGFLNALGMYKFDEDGFIKDVEIIFSNSSRKGSGGDLIPGQSSVDVDLKANDQIGFFVASNAYRKNDPMYLETGSYVITDEAGNPASIYSDELLTLTHHGADGAETSIRTEYGYNLFYSHADPDHDYAPNVDRYPHTVGYVHKNDGIVTLGFEDLIDGGDHDYTDIILEFDIGRSNAAVLDPNLDYDYEGYDTWVDTLRLSEGKRIDVGVKLD